MGWGSTKGVNGSEIPGENGRFGISGKPNRSEAAAEELVGGDKLMALSRHCSLNVFIFSMKIFL